MMTPTAAYRIKEREKREGNWKERHFDLRLKCDPIFLFNVP
jgi:hypothetical protein